MSTPTDMITAVIAISGPEARLWRNGSLRVRMTWMIKVCVSRLSTNQPVWNSAAFSMGQALNT